MPVTERTDVEQDMSVAFGYILVTRGPRPSSFAEALKLQHTRVQARIVRKVAGFLKVSAGKPMSVRFLSDKTSWVESLSSLPFLKRSLDETSLPVVVADILKIFSHCPSGAREVLLAELLAYGDRIMTWLDNRPVSLAQLAETLKPILLNPQSYRSEHQSMRVRASTVPDQRTEWTEPGREESARVRGEHADKVARLLLGIRTELLEKTGRATHAEIAELANAQGLLSSRGRPIRPNSVSQALKRLGSE